MDSSSLLVNLVFALGAAVLGAALATKLRQSAILGYILAGIAIGPFTPGFVGDIDAVQALADVGIIFLMFTIGAQLSFRDLLAVGKVAILGGTVQVLLMIGLGYLAGIALGWAPLEALFFGAVLSNSSSAVLTKVLGERGELDSEHGRISLAWSSVQDLGTIMLVVVLSALAVAGDGFWPNLLWTAVKAGVFLALLAPLGAKVLPWLFERVADLQNREVFILTVAAIALGMAYVSSFFGLSLALGAFVAGVVVGESDLSHQIVGEITPLRDIFAGLFFVSVGMLVNPGFVVDNLGIVLLTLLLIVVAKGLISAGITALTGYSARTATLTAVTLGQSAEFSFLLASLGAGLGVVGSSVFSLMLAGVAASIVLSPVLVGLAEPAAAWIERRLPLSPLARHAYPEDSSDGVLRGHAVICGYGRVGRVIGSALKRRRFPFVVVDLDARKVRRLREQGVPALCGNAANPVLLEQVGLAKARILVVAIPDALAARRLVDYAKRISPELDIVVRTHSGREREFMQRRGVREVVMGELELALEMARHTLRRFGVSGPETQAAIQGLRERAEVDGLGAWPDSAE